MTRTFVSSARSKAPARPSVWLALAALALPVAAAPSAAQAQPYVIASGSASMTITEGLANSISEFDAYFTAPTTRADCLSLPAPGNAPFTEAGTVGLIDPLRPYWEVPLNDAGGTTPGAPGASRTRQANTFQIENLGNVLASWTTSNDNFAFVGDSVLGEQIALTRMQRWTGPFSGVLVYGDFALRNTGSKLVLTSNIDFLSAAWADIGNPVINVTGNTLTITGDLLIGGGLTVLDPTAVLGTDFGDFSLTATLSAVPEPGSLSLLAVGGLSSLGWLRRRRRRRVG